MTERQNAMDDDDASASWEDAEDFELPREEAPSSPARANDDDDDDDTWSSVRKRSTPEEKQKPQEPKPQDACLLLVNMTALSAGAIHNRHDVNGVNDVAAKSALTRKIEAGYASYAANAALLADGTVRPCSAGVWRAALAALRDEHPGQYWCPVWPPKR